MLYFVQTNMIALVFGLILLIQCRRTSSRNETSQMIMFTMISALIIASLADIMAYVFRGTTVVAVQFFNILYFISFVLGTYAWFVYILVRFRYITNLKLIVLRTGLPAIVLCLSILLNPLTSFYFSVDADAIYHRGNGVIVTWIVEWGYLVAAFVINMIAIRKEKSRQKRQMYKGYLLFPIPMAVAAICQMIFYGITVAQIGYLFSILLLFLNNIAYHEQQDGLTGLKNKNSFYIYKDMLFEKDVCRNISIFVIDANKFKAINDTYGHLIGDKALIDIANVLQESVEDIPRSGIVVFRFGGDEFVIVANGASDDDVTLLVNTIGRKITERNAKNKEEGQQYVLDLSIGIATGDCTNKKEFDYLLNKADELMYEQKQSLAKR